MFYSDRISYYENPENEVKCIRIDSIEPGRDSIVFPFSNIQFIDYNCASPYGASWIGEMVVVRAIGEHLFQNKYGDTITIYTRHPLNMPWRIYQDDEVVINAQITQHDTSSFLGLVDSVKTIGFQVYDKFENQISHSLNNKTILISKHYGVVRVLNFYQFPDYDQLNYGYKDDRLTELDLVGSRAIAK